MKIKRIKAKNFYSFQELDLDFNKLNGIVRITGKNKDSGGSNGSGKSSILESVVWGLFGKTIRKSTEESLVNNITGKNCEVAVLIENSGLEIQIRRTKRPTSLNLFVDGVNKNAESAVETQKRIEELLQLDYKSFLASVVFGQHSEISFLDSSPEDKRNIIKNCFNLEEFFSKRNSVKELKSKYTAESKLYSQFLSQLESERDKLEKSIPDKKYKYIDLPPLQSVLDAEKQIQQLLNSITPINSEISKNKDKLKKLESQIKEGEYASEKDCPVCKSKYVKCQTHDDIVKLEFEKQSIQSTIDFDINQIEKLKSNIEALKPSYTSTEWAKYNDKNKMVLEAQKHLDKLEEVKSKIEGHKKLVVSLSNKVEIMKFWELAFSEKGIVKYIIRNILDYFNLKSNEYTSILTNNQFSIEFSDELAETIKNRGIETKYISLSGGENRKINLAIMLALQDLSTKISKVNCNLIFFDEVCDNIDNLGIESIHNLLHTLKIQHSDKVLFIITHNNYLQDLLIETKEIKVIKEKGLSKIV